MKDERLADCPLSECKPNGWLPISYRPMTNEELRAWERKPDVWAILTSCEFGAWLREHNEQMRALNEKLF